MIRFGGKEKTSCVIIIVNVCVCVCMGVDHGLETSKQFFANSKHIVCLHTTQRLLLPPKMYDPICY